ncbi:MAG: T9SS type A sorting domain-containing protein, partial [Flavobacteriales bacterium]|nr:T9SS type A sorting domain-containing protein [Flavobacteriales bacterium]
GNRKWVYDYSGTPHSLVRNDMKRIDDNRFAVVCNNITTTGLNFIYGAAIIDSSGNEIWKRRKGYSSVVYRKPVWAPFSSLIIFQNRLVISGAFDLNNINEGFVFSLDTLGRHTPKFDSLWPGDCNKDGIANMYDIFPIGLYYDSTQFSRDNPQITWNGQLSPLWQDTSFTGLNFREADVNGDGTIESADIQTIIDNYGLTHAKDESPLINSFNANLELAVANDSVPINDSLVISVRLGDTNNAFDSLYGIAFSLNYDPQLLDTSQIKVDFGNSWVGITTFDLVSLHKNLPSQGRVDISMVRTDRQNALPGSGEICSVEIFTTDDLSGITVGNSAPLDLSITGVKAITVNEIELQMGAVDTTVLVYDSLLVGQGEPELLKEIQIFPNPTSGLLNVSPMNEVYGIRVNDVSGKMLIESQLLDGFLDISHLNPGIYQIEIMTTKNIFNKQILKY